MGARYLSNDTEINASDSAYNRCVALQYKSPMDHSRSSENASAPIAARVWQLASVFLPPRLSTNALQDGSQDLNSRYGCTMPEGGDLCGVIYDTSESFNEFKTISSVKIGTVGVGLIPAVKGS